MQITIMKEIIRLRMANDTNGDFLYCKYILNNKLSGGIQRKMEIQNVKDC